jgi:hypothetical protein
MLPLGTICSCAKFGAEEALKGCFDLVLEADKGSIFNGDNGTFPSSTKDFDFENASLKFPFNFLMVLRGELGFSTS